MSKFGKEYHKAYYQKRKSKVIDFLGGKCVICGSTEQLEIDHINPSDKTFSINKKLSIKHINELEKCQLLCAIHHREKTAKENSGFTHGTIYGFMRKKCTCDECQEAKNTFNKDRKAARMAKLANAVGSNPTAVKA